MPLLLTIITPRGHIVGPLVAGCCWLLSGIVSGPSQIWHSEATIVVSEESRCAVALQTFVLINKTNERIKIMLHYRDGPQRRPKAAHAHPKMVWRPNELQLATCNWQRATCNEIKMQSRSSAMLLAGCDNDSCCSSCLEHVAPLDSTRLHSTSVDSPRLAALCCNCRRHTFAAAV